MNVEELLDAQRRFFQSGATGSRQFRLQQLDLLARAIEQREGDVLAALKEDLGKCEFESYTSEIGFLYEELRFARKHLRRWMRVRRVPTPLLHAPATSRVYYRPHGVSAILAPWNYPFQLALAPVIAAIAAGNCVILKPSELAPATAGILDTLITETFPREYLSVVNGGPEVARQLTAAPVDHIFFTGSTAVGRQVMRAAADHLVPVTLELGGKSPAIVAADARVSVAAHRIAWGKFLNAGQTCVAPDYVCVHASVAEQFIREITAAVQKWYGGHPAASPDYGRIINEGHFQRLNDLLQRQRGFSREVVLLGSEPDRATRFVPPILCPGTTFADPIMEEEIFGPILPILVYQDFTDLMRTIAARPTPLAAYLFSESKSVQQQFVRNLPFGGATINDTIVHLVNAHLPFGGSGASGMGSYHGEAGFRGFSHAAAVMKRGTRFDPPLKYPPYGDRLAMIRRVMRR